MAHNQYSWLDTEEYPFRPHYYQVQDHKLHYIDEGTGQVILFVHGTPSWSFDYRNIIKNLQSNFRCIAIDHIGFGLSDKPEDYQYSTLTHSSILEQFILEKDLRNIILVTHDFGGPIGLNAAIHHPERIQKIVTFNSWLWSSEQEEEFIKLKKVLESPILPFLYRNLNFSPKFLLPKSFGDKPLSKTLLKQYTKPFANRKQRNGALGFAKSLLADQQWFEELWNNKTPIANKPMLFLWGMKDPIITPKHLQKFQTGFTNSQTVELESCGHFPQEEEPERVIAEIRKFLL
jgi:haloalkane dehalogenase